MEGGLLSLRWNDHGQTFLNMLSGVRKREAYCDVTLACDGRFYPVHKLVLSTCSDFFDQMFEKTACKHPVVVVANVAHKDLEALINYMYLGSVNVLQTELSGLMKAAEALRIKGLSEPSEGSSGKDSREGKRSSSWEGDLPDGKRKKPEETSSNVPRRSQSPASESDRTINTRDTQKSRTASNDSQTSRLNMQGSSSSGSSTNNSTNQSGPSSSTDQLSHPPRQDLGASPQVDIDHEPSEKALRPEVKMEEVQVKEEPAGWFPETEEGLENLEYSEAETSLRYGGQQATYQGSCLPWELANITTQAHTLDTHMPQGIPGPSRMQGILQTHSEATTDHFIPSTSQTRCGKLYIAGFTYTRNRSRGIRSYWRCTNRSCPGRLVLLRDDVVKTKTHSHPPHTDGKKTADQTKAVRGLVGSHIPRSTDDLKTGQLSYSQVYK